MPPLTVRQLRRFPVKSCGGEAVASVAVSPRGLDGDRLWAAVDDDGKFASGKNTRRFRRRDDIFTLEARSAGLVPEVRFPDDRWLRVDAPGADAELSAHMGAEMRFAPEGEVSHMDAGCVSLVGTATLAEMGRLSGGAELDPRRLRVNIVVETQEPWVEETWIGRELRIGDVVLASVARIERCRMVDIAQDGVPAQGGLLKAISDHRALQLATYADVALPGRIAVGDVVSV